MQVRVLPGALRIYGGTSRWPATAAVSKTEGPHGRASSILAPSADGRRRRGGPAPGCYPGRGPGHEVRLLHLPPGSVGPAGVDARLSSGRSRVRVPYGARVGGRRAVVAAGCQSGLSSRAARVRSPSTAHHARPHGLAVKDARFSAGRTPVRARLGVPRLSWRNRQTHRLQVAAPPWHVGSTPTESTRESTPTCRNGRRAALRARCPSGREGSTPSVGTSGRGQVSRLALQVRRPGFDTPPLHQPTRRRTRVRG